MSEQCDGRSLINGQIVGIDDIMVPVKVFTLAEPFRQCWEREIYNRFREAKSRFPEFFPCFELKYNPVEGLQYSIHFEPLTDREHVTFADLPSSPNPFSQLGRRGAGLKSLSRSGRGI